MSSSLRGPGKAALVALLAGGALAAVLLGGHLFVITQSMAGQRQLAEDQVLAQGRALRQHLMADGFRPPGGSITALEGPSLLQPGALVHLRQVALFFGTRAIWTLPPGTASPPAEPPLASADAVERSGPLWVYVYGLPDGRSLAATFELPLYTRRSGRMALAAGLEASALLTLILLLGYLASRIYRRGHEEGAVLPGSKGGASPQAMVALFQQTLKELRSRTEEMEELHRRERARAEDVERMAEALCANLEAGYLRFGEDGRLTGVNAAARALLRLQEVPRIGDRADHLLKEREGVLQVVEEVRSTRALALREEVPGPPGILLQVVGIPLFNLLHQLKGYLLLLRDQTGVYQMRRTLREREALTRLGEVAAGVAHEVRNALSTISARLRLLSQDVPSLDGNASFRALAEEARNLEQVMQNLLFFARPLPLEREAVDMVALLEEEREAIEAAHGGEVRVLVEAEPVAVQADREALARALRNLTRNAIEAMAEGQERAKTLRLSCGPEEALARLRVEDSGPGIPEGARGNAFTPFVSQKPGGTGLGLAIARKIAREHGGDLVYFESALGGAGFELSLPR